MAKRHRRKSPDISLPPSPYATIAEKRAREREEWGEAYNLAHEMTRESEIPPIIPDPELPITKEPMTMTERDTLTEAFGDGDEWEQYQPEDKFSAVGRRHPALTFSKSGHININQSASTLMGNPEYVTLHYNKTQGAVGIRLAFQDTPGALRIRASKKNRTNGTLNYIVPFLVKHNLNFKESVRFPCEVSPDGTFLFCQIQGVEGTPVFRRRRK